MSISLQTNMASIRTRRSLAASTQRLDRTYGQMASGQRVNSARDDAAGLQISDRMTAQINGISQAMRNSMDGISMLQVAEGGLQSITDSLQRIRVLAVQSVNGTNSEDERQAIQLEVAELSAEINRVARETTFGGKKILAGEHDFKLDNIGSTISPYKTLKPVMIFPMGADHSTQGVIDKYHESMSVDFQAGAYAGNLVGVDFGIRFVGNLFHYDEYDQFGCTYGAFGSNVKTFLGFDLNSMYLAVLSNPNTMATRFVEESEPLALHTTGFTVGSDGFAALDVSTPQAAEKVLDYVDSFIAAVDSGRAELGAAQNRLESAVRNQASVGENVSDARSRIRDTDYARATADMSVQNILKQGAVSILTQANELPQIAMTLLQAAA